MFFDEMQVFTPQNQGWNNLSEEKTLRNFYTTDLEQTQIDSARKDLETGKWRGLFIIFSKSISTHLD